MFFKLFTNQEKPQPVRPKKARDGIEHITSHEQIGILLKNMLEQHALLTIYPDGDTTGYISAIIKVSTAKHIFLLDGIKPAKAHQSLVESGRFKAIGRLHGIKTSFSGTISSTGEDAGMPYYRVGFPAEIIHEQKRQYFRASMPLDNSLKVMIRTSDDTMLEGELRDMSVGGICATLEGTFHSELEKGMLLSNCRISLSEQEEITTSLELRYLGTRTNSNKTYIGARFVDIDKATRRHIQHLVGKLDRKSTKNRQRTSP